MWITKGTPGITAKNGDLYYDSSLLCKDKALYCKENLFIKGQLVCLGGASCEKDLTCEGGLSAFGGLICGGDLTILGETTKTYFYLAGRCNWPLTITDGYIQIGCDRRTKEDWREWFRDENEAEAHRRGDGIWEIRDTILSFCK